MLSIRDLPYVVLIAAVVSLLFAVLIYLAGSVRGSRRKRSCCALLAGGVAGSAVAYVLATLSPLTLLGEVSGLGSPDFPQNVNLVPIVDMLSASTELLLVNALLLAPFGFLLRMRWPYLSLTAVALGSLVFATMIEGVQLFHPLRGTNVDDIILNVAGAVAAAWVASLVPLRRCVAEE